MDNCSFTQSSASRSMLSISLRRRPTVLEAVLLVVALVGVGVILVVLVEAVVVLVVLDEEGHAVVDLTQVNV